MRSILMLFLSGLYSSEVTTDIADDIEERLHLNRVTFLSNPRTRSSKAQALAFYDAQWNYLKSRNGCGARTLGLSGVRCVDERGREGQWPWVVYYRDPIEQASTID